MIRENLIMLRNTHGFSQEDIPKAARERFGLTGGQRLIVFSDDKEDIALVPADIFEERMKKAMEYASAKPEEQLKRFKIGEGFPITKITSEVRSFL